MINRRLTVILVVSFVLASAAKASAQRNELGLSLGGMITSDRTIEGPPGSINVKGSLTYYINYATRIADFKLASVHLEFPLAGTPSTDLSSANPLLPRNYASLFFTPGIKVKLLPGGSVSPYAVIGGGLGRFSESDSLLNGQPNGGNKGTNRGVLDYGGGVDLRVLPFLSLRGEVRDFVSGNPQFNFPVSGRQHNVLTSGGVVLRF
jgi:hypothetical protein